MGATRGITGAGTIGDAAMFAHGHLRIQHVVLPHKIAPAATPHLAMMTGSGVAAAPIAPEATVSGGRSAPRKGITLMIVLSGRQPSAPLASPST